MLELTCRRAGIADGMTVLDAGCGWGALSLYIAEHFPHCRVVAVSNSLPQRQFIEGLCRERGIASVEIRTADIDAFDPGQAFDRILSIEMFEHLRNYREMLRRFSSWLDSEGKVFIHVFCHREFAYLYESEGEDDWMGQYFFHRRDDAFGRPAPLLPERSYLWRTTGWCRDAITKKPPRPGFATSIGTGTRSFPF